jgi:hypothetical protein
MGLRPIGGAGPFFIYPTKPARLLVRIADLLARMQGAVKETPGSTVNVTVTYVDKAVILPSATPPALPPGD